MTSRLSLATLALALAVLSPQSHRVSMAWIIAYAANLGPVQNTPPSGIPAPLASLYPLVTNVTPYLGFKLILTISGQQIITELPYIGLVPGSIGVYQVNFRLPDHLPSGNIELHLERTQDCGFFFQLRCGRGPTITPTLKVKLPTAG